MKRFLCILLPLCLLLGTALAEDGWDEDDWDEFGENWEYLESRFGYSLWYNADQLCFTTEEFEGSVAECFCPWDDHSGVAAMICRGSRFSSVRWDDYTPIELDDVFIWLEYPYEMTAYTDGEIIAEQWVVSAADRDYVFIIQYEADDVQNFAILFHDTLSGLEFPNQPAENADFRLDFFQGGAAGMQFTDVIVDEEADAVVLIPLREMKDFVLEYMEWNMETMESAVDRTLYTAPVLSPVDANLRIFSYFEDVMPTLRVRYTDAERKAQSCYFFQSGRDGSLMLLSESEL